MERNEKQNTDNADQIAKSMLAEEKDKQRETTRRMNRLWLWLAVLFLVAILIWFIFGLGLFEASVQ
ncbi:MAG: hypothetical protein J1E82_00735 [Muribaculaceae bacterium]|nr:hypothetical protein [Muribaculaceae bacterium]